MYVQTKKEILKKQLNCHELTYKELFASSSAAGGLKITVHGLVYEMTAKAAKEAKLFGEVEIVASSEDKKYNYIPKGWTVPEDADYFHITTNNTIYGTEIRTDYDVKVPLVADMSSDLFSRPVEGSHNPVRIYGENPV